MSLKVDIIFWVQGSRVQESERSVVHRPSVQSPSVQASSRPSPSVQSPSVQTMCTESRFSTRDMLNIVSLSLSFVNSGFLDTINQSLVKCLMATASRKIS